MEEQLQKEIILMAKKVYGDRTEVLRFNDPDLRNWIGYSGNSFSGSLVFNYQKDEEIINCNVGFASVITDNEVEIINFYVQKEAGDMFGVKVHNLVPENEILFRISIMETIKEILSKRLPSTGLVLKQEAIND